MVAARTGSMVPYLQTGSRETYIGGIPLPTHPREAYRVVYPPFHPPPGRHIREVLVSFTHPREAYQEGLASFYPPQGGIWEVLASVTHPGRHIGRVLASFYHPGRHIGRF